MTLPHKHGGSSLKDPVPLTTDFQMMEDGVPETLDVRSYSYTRKLYQMLSGLLRSEGGGQ